MPYPVPFMHGEKGALRRVFHRHPQVKEQFNRFIDTPSYLRLDILDEAHFRQQRILWREAGIPEENVQSLAGHSIAMMRMAQMNPQKNMPSMDVMTLIRSVTVAQAVTGAFDFSHDLKEESRNVIERIGLRVLFDFHRNDPLQRGWERVQTMRCAASRWVHDLNILATMEKAIEYKAAYPHLSAGLDAIGRDLSRKLVTDAGRALYAQMNTPAPNNDWHRNAPAA